MSLGKASPDELSRCCDDLAAVLWTLKMFGFTTRQVDFFGRADSREIHVLVDFGGDNVRTFKVFDAPGLVDTEELTACAPPALERWKGLTERERYMHITNAPWFETVADFVVSSYKEGCAPPCLAKGKFLVICPSCKKRILYDLNDKKLTHDFPACPTFEKAKTGSEFAEWVGNHLIARLRRFGDVTTPDSDGDN